MNRTTRTQWTEQTLPLNGRDLVEAYRAEWNRGKKPPLRWFDVERMANNSTPAGLLADDVRRCTNIRESLNRFADKMKESLASEDGDNYLPILFALEDSGDLSTIFLNLLRNLPVSKKAYLLGEIVKLFASAHGRNRTRDQVALLWRARRLLEEEKESVVEAMIDDHIANWNTLSAVSLEAHGVALALLRRGKVSVFNLGDFPGITQIATDGTSSDPIADRARALTQQVALPVRLIGAGLMRDELARLQANWLHPVFAAIALGRGRRFLHPMIDEILHFRDREWPFPFSLSYGENTGNALSTLGVPLIRLLHMRLILESPSLGDSVTQPENALVPEVMLYLLRKDGVTYTPTLYLTPGSERGWRRRWAEITGEALSCLFLMDALPLDITTLRRIPESNGENTPDFQATTFDRELIVFESKGSTSWDSFRKSKRKAFAQLNKAGRITEWEKNLSAQGTNRGRSFACCLFAACGEEPEPSQFHVDDPPFGFEHLFRDGWQEAARRRHYTGVLQAAGLFREATALANGREFEPNLNQAREIPLGFGDQRVFSVVGTERSLNDLAGPVGFPESDTLLRCRIFQGIEKDTYQALSAGRLPIAKPFGPLFRERADSESNSSPPYSEIPPFGYVAERGPSERTGGVFSRMSNGSCLYVDWSQPMK